SPFADGSNLDLMGAMLPDGTLLCGHEVLPEGASLAGRPYAETVLSATDVVVGPLDVSPLTGNQVLPVLYPVRNSNGDSIGAMVAMMNLESFMTIELVDSLPDGAF